MGHRRQHQDEAGPSPDAGLLLMVTRGPTGDRHVLPRAGRRVPRRGSARGAPPDDRRRAAGMAHRARNRGGARSVPRNRLGPRPVQGTGRPAKSGYLDEIVVTTRSSPERAVWVAILPALFSPPVSRLVVDESSITSRRYELDWDARIALWPWQQRRVRLRLYASPSLNVTVLALSPTKPRPAARRRFLLWATG